MIERAREGGVFLRPHVKTHKCAGAAVIQTGGRKGGIVCSTLAEMRLFTDAGFEDILYGVPFEPHKLTLLNRHFPSAILLLDSLDHVRLLEEAGLPRKVYIKVDTGYHRAGVGKEDAVQIARRILSHPSPSPSPSPSPFLSPSPSPSSLLTLQGLYSHSGHTYDGGIEEKAGEDHRYILQVAARIQEQLGYTVPSVSVGSTPHCSCISSYQEGVTEIHPGNYLFYDRQQWAVGACDMEDIACTVGTRVIGRYPDRNQLLIDVGSLAISKDTCSDGGYGKILGYPDAKITRVSQEVSVVTPFLDLPLGSFLQVLPNHSCLSSACFSTYYVHDESGRIVDVWKPCREWSPDE
jgi:D-serine deaminase-like pyridoxal phosphate-dependent protein